MPPVSYVITTVVPAALVAISIPMTLGYSIILWYWLFAAAACIVAVVGVFRVVGGLHAPLWIGAALALPGVVWAAKSLYGLVGSPLQFYFTFYFAAYLALLAAAFGALRLIEIISAPHAAFRVGYGLLAASALLVGVGWLAYARGWTFPSHALYDTPARALGIAAKLIEYGAFIGVAVVIATRRGVEPWTAVVITIVTAYLFYKATNRIFSLPDPVGGDGLMFWLEPVVMLVGAAAVWRMGSVLRAQPPLEWSLQT
jgi:hypothetical protein